MEQDKHNNQTSLGWKLLSALCILALLGTTCLWFFTKQALQEEQTLRADKEQKLLEAEQFATALQLENDHFRLIQPFLASSSLKYFTLKPTNANSSSNITLAWNREKQEAVMWSSPQLQQKRETQFQLWVKSDGNYLSVGLFYADELGTISEPFPLTVPNPQHFIITEERLGGAKEPSLTSRLFQSDN